MKYGSRKLYFLRISKVTVLPLMVQLLPQNVAWFTDTMCQVRRCVCFCGAAIVLRFSKIHLCDRSREKLDDENGI